jgi:KUP system potassium uptake protein
VLATFVYLCMSTWSIGRTVLNRALAQSVSLERTLANVGRSGVTRVPGTAVFLMRAPDAVPIVLLHHLKHNKVLHERVVLLTVIPEEVPFVDEADRMRVEVLEGGFWRVVARAGFMEHPQIPALLERCATQGLVFDPLDTTFYLGRETLLSSGRSPLPYWRKRLFSLLARNATPATRFFGLPPNRVVELGAQIEL